MHRYIKQIAIGGMLAACAVVPAQANTPTPQPTPALPAIQQAPDGVESELQVDQGRVFCYNRRTGRFLHWGPCRRTVRVYCYNRRTGRFLHWGRCRR